MLEVNYKKCTGCGACVQKCPQKCITLTTNVEGFLYPKINEEECCNCGICQKVCIIDQNVETNEIGTTYAAKAIQKTDCLKATSGGVFGALAEYVINKGGIVFGCTMDDSHIVKHIGIEQINRLDEIKGSKYIQSNTINTFTECRNELNTGRLVMYSGTPCQIASLKSFLGKEYQNLVTVDLICHGVPSQAYFNKYFDWLEKDNKATVRNLDFRSKKTEGWSLAGSYEIEKGSSIQRKPLYYFEHYYYFYFLEGSIYRESCYSCQFASMHRPGDFTLGDLWGAEGLELKVDIQDGCSLVIANNERAKSLLTKLKIDYEEVELNDALKYNAQLNTPSVLPNSRSERLREYENNSADEINRIFIKSNFKKILISKVKYLLPYKIRRKLLELKYKQR